MKKTSGILALLLAVSLLLTLGACSNQTTAPTETAGSDASAPVEAAPVSKDIVVGWTGGVEGFDPAWSNNGIGIESVYEALFMNNPDTGKLEGCLADTYEWIDDTTLKIGLKDGITFSNGDPLKPSDILWSMQYYVEIGSNLTTYYTNYDWDNCEIIDDKTFTIKFFEPYGPALNYMTLAKIQSQSYYEANGDAAFWDKPCGTGPYTVAENVAGSHTVYTLRDDYWGEKPEAEKITVKSYSEATTMYIDFENGAIDMAFRLDALDAERAMAASGNGTVAVMQSALDTVMMSLPYYVEEFDDIRVREAIAIGVEWDAVAEAAFGVLCEPATSTLPSLVNYHIDTAGYQYDPERAKTLMAEAGYADGFDLKLVIVSSTTNSRMAEAIQSYFKDLNINLTIESYDPPTAIPMFMKGETDFILKETMGGATCLEPDQIYDTLKANSTLSAAAVLDEEFDGYLMTGLYTVDDAQRRALYENAQTWLYENIRAIPVCDTTACYVYKDHLSLNTVSVQFPYLRFVHFK